MNRQRVWEVTPYSPDLRVNCAIAGRRVAGRGDREADSTATFLVTIRRNHSRTVETMALKWENTEG